MCIVPDKGQVAAWVDTFAVACGHNAGSTGQLSSWGGDAAGNSFW